jgi:hypothetical protein
MTSFSTPKTGPLTKEYEAGHVENFGKPKERFCKCGYLPAWCRCMGVASSANFTNIRGPRYIKPPGRNAR